MEANGKHLVFVYGTLRKGFALHGILKENGAEFVGKAVTLNKYHMTASGCPFVHPTIQTSKIVGEVYKVNDLLLKRLDQVEGFYGDPDNSNYFRAPVDVELEDGTALTPDIYFNKHRATDTQVIPSGDYGDYDDGWNRRYHFA